MDELSRQVRSPDPRTGAASTDIGMTVCCPRFPSTPCNGPLPLPSWSSLDPPTATKPPPCPLPHRQSQSPLLKTGEAHCSSHDPCPGRLLAHDGGGGRGGWRSVPPHHMPRRAMQNWPRRGMRQGPSCMTCRP
ncbi:hypothetical protein MLD38_001257 [Melastoma candidum]|uniref:Uncharacterized protein n=1 Tax=Melastoma candidum TaxID=119954 RepID=A0ACB9SC46_9MYRT|nr:hypothetical protein MLD38_001257 [Melastoma candidum]